MGPDETLLSMIQVLCALLSTCPRRQVKSEEPSRLTTRHPTRLWLRLHSVDLWAEDFRIGNVK